MKRKQRQLNLEQNVERLKELFKERPSSLPEVIVDQLSPIHLRLTCEGRRWDYWPSTSRAWEVNSNVKAIVMPPDDVWAVVTGAEDPVFELARTGKPDMSPWAHERRVLRWLEKHDRKH